MQVARLTVTREDLSMLVTVRVTRVDDEGITIEYATDLVWAEWDPTTYTYEAVDDPVPNVVVSESLLSCIDHGLVLARQHIDERRSDRYTSQRERAWER
jgi:hypothetical protein